MAALVNMKVNIVSAFSLFTATHYLIENIFALSYNEIDKSEF